MIIFILALCFIVSPCCLCETFSDSYRIRLEQHADEETQNLADQLIDLKCVNTINDGQTILHTCVHRNQLTCVKKLLDNGADPLIKDNNNQTALFYAETEYDYPNITAVIKIHLNNSNSAGTAEKPCQLNSTEWDKIGFDNIKSTLMQIVADGTMNKPDAAWLGKTLLHIYVQLDKISVVKFLLEHGADPNIKDNYGKTPLEYAEENGQSEIVNLLTNAVHPTTQQP